MLLLGACSGDDATVPTSPSDQPPAVEADSIAVSPDQAAVEEGEALEFSARVFEASGEEIIDAEVTWSSANSSVATVNDSGFAQAQSRGFTSITASVDELSASADLRVRTGETVTIDSTRLALVSDSTDREEGIHRFEVREGDPPDLEVGDIIVGAQRRGFLRRITEVTTIDATAVELRTEQAALAEAVESGSFQATVPVGPGAPSSRIQRDNVIIGAARAVGFSPTVTVEDDALLIEDHKLVAGEVCFDANGGTQCADVTLTIPNGRIAFQPEVDIGVEVGFFSIDEFHAIGEGNLEFDLNAELQSSARAEFSDEIPLDNGFFRTPFVVHLPGTPFPLVGEVRLEFFVGYDITMAGDGSIGSGVDTSFETRVGARFENDAWTEIFEATPSLQAEPIEIVLQGGATARLWVKPKITIFFYRTAGPNTFLKPFLEGSATFSEECTYDLKSGLDAGLGFEVEVLSFELASFSRTFSLGTETLLSEALACGADQSLPTATIAAPAGGAVFTEGEAITFEGSGEDPEDGPLTGEALAWESDLDGQLGTGESFTRSDLSVGSHTITLTATDTDGGSDTDQVTITVEAMSGNELPTATIAAPAGGAVFTEGEAITFEGSGEDPEDGPLTGEALAWESDLDGQLGTGESFTRSDLSVGSHTITLTATDTDGGSDTDQVTITVEPDDPSGDIALGDTVTGVIDVLGEVDEYTFEGTEGQEVAVFLQGLTGSLSDDFELRLLDRAGTADETVLGEVARSDGNDASLTDGLATQSTGRVMLPRTATYTIRVQGAESEHDSGEYRFLLHPVDRAPENRGAAIMPGDTIDGVELEPPADIDEYTFEGAEGQEVAVFLQGLTGSLSDDFELRLLDRAGTADETVLGEVARSDGNDASLTDGLATQSTGRVTLPRTATYTIRVQGAESRHDSGEYRFLLHPVDRAPENRGAAIMPGDTIDGVELEPPADIDEYTFEGAEGQEVAVFLQGLTGSLSDDFRLRLLDRAGTADETVLGEVARSDGNDASLTDGLATQSTGRVTLPRTATYTIRVQGAESRHDSGEYRFLLHPVDRAPENRGAAIAPGDTIDGVELEPPADIDEYTFEGAEGQEVAVFLQGLTGSLSDDFELRLLDRAGTADETVLGEVARSDGNDASLEDQSTGTVSLPRTATYTVRIHGRNSRDDSGEYRFHVRD